MSRRTAIRAIKDLVALTALEMDWTEDDTVKTSRLSDSSLILTSQFWVCMLLLIQMANMSNLSLC